MSLLAIGLVLLALVLVGVPIAIALGCVAVLAMITGSPGSTPVAQNEPCTWNPPCGPWTM